MEYQPIQAKFDTHNVVRRLTDVGIQEAAAEIVVETIQKAISTSYSELATKAELIATKAELIATKNELKAENVLLHQKIDMVAALLNQKIDSKIESLEHKLTVKMGAMIFTAVVTLVGTQWFLKFFA